MFIKGTPEPATSVIPAETGKGKRRVGFQQKQMEVGGELTGTTKIRRTLH